MVHGRCPIYAKSVNGNKVELGTVIDPLAVPIGYPAAACIIAVGYAWIRHPQMIFRIRNSPGLTEGSGLNEAGVGFYRVLGYLFVLLGVFVLLLTVVGGPSSLR